MNINDFIRENSFLNNEELLRRFAEIVIDRCAEQASLMLKYPWIPEEKELELDKESILNVKKELI